MTSRSSVSTPHSEAVRGQGHNSIHDTQLSRVRMPEGRQGADDRRADPHRVLALERRGHLDALSGDLWLNTWSAFRAQPFSEALEHGIAASLHDQMKQRTRTQTNQHDVVIEFFLNVRVARLYGLMNQLVKALSQQVIADNVANWLRQFELRALVHALFAFGGDRVVCKHLLSAVKRARCPLMTWPSGIALLLAVVQHFGLGVEGNVASLCLMSHHMQLTATLEREAAVGQQRLQCVAHILTA